MGSTINTIYTSKSGDIAIEKVVIACSKCKQKVKIPLFKNQKLTVTCPRCRTVFKFNCRRHRIAKHIIAGCLILLALILTVADIALPFLMIKNSCGIAAQKQQSYVKDIQEMQDSYAVELVGLEKKYDDKIASMNIDKLSQRATLNYSFIWTERSNYNSRYAITLREKAQLKMVSLSKEKNRSIEEIVEKIALEAAPSNSEIRAYTTVTGVNLDVNFDMSEVTTGEKGAKTKHGTIDSLKKETIRLISKVTTDLYVFCKDLELDNIAIGCKHFVTIDYQDDSSFDDNIIIYKISLDREDIKSLEYNPFLNKYAITKYFTIEKDGFPSLYLKDIS